MFQNKAPLPRRFLYVGEAYDSHISGTEYQVKAPHLENELNSPFCSNYISTTKYTPVTFLPLNLFEQFNKKANVYFLLIALLSWTDFSPKSPFFSVAPLTFVLMVSAVKEIYEDVKRFEMDKEINNRKVLTFRPNEDGSEWKFRRIAWQDLEVGDLIKVTKEERAFPADTLLLQSSTNQGLCNIETANLDGETNLKIKQAVGATYSIPAAPSGEDYPTQAELQFVLESEVCVMMFCMYVDKQTRIKTKQTIGTKRENGQV